MKQAMKKRFVVKVEVLEVIEHRGKEITVPIINAASQSNVELGLLEVARAYAIGKDEGLRHLVNNYLGAACVKAVREFDYYVTEIVHEMV